MELDKISKMKYCPNSPRKENPIYFAKSMHISSENWKTENK